MRYRLCALLLLAACDNGVNPELVTDLDMGYYQCQVQPLMDRSCAFSGCHGDPARPLLVYSTSKTRIAGDELLGEGLTDKEVCANYYRVMAFAQVDPPQSQLITKPATLDGFASQFHAGNYMFGAEDPEALCLIDWMQGAVQPEQASLPPEACALPWRKSASGLAPKCTPRTIDCATALAGPDLPEEASR